MGWGVGREERRDENGKTSVVRCQGLRLLSPEPTGLIYTMIDHVHAKSPNCPWVRLGSLIDGSMIVSVVRRAAPQVSWHVDNVEWRGWLAEKLSMGGSQEGHRVVLLLGGPELGSLGINAQTGRCRNG